MSFAPISHGPENAEYELRKAYKYVVEIGSLYFSRDEAREIPGAHPEEVAQVYHRAYKSYREGNRLAAERWARTAKHLARALQHEATIHYIEPRVGNLPFLEGVRGDEFGLRYRADTTQDLLDSVAEDLPPGYQQMPTELRRYLGRGREHLKILDKPGTHHELLRSERIMAAHEYGRVIECQTLALEAEGPPAQTAA